MLQSLPPSFHLPSKNCPTRQAPRPLPAKDLSRFASGVPTCVALGWSCAERSPCFSKAPVKFGPVFAAGSCHWFILLDCCHVKVMSGCKSVSPDENFRALGNTSCTATIMILIFFQNLMYVVISLGVSTKQTASPVTDTIFSTCLPPTTYTKTSGNISQRCEPKG